MHLIGGFIGLKAFLHHHLLDYAKTLACKGKYGYYVKKLKSPSIALDPRWYIEGLQHSKGS